jgi:hypothetical protein
MSAPVLFAVIRVVTDHVDGSLLAFLVNANRAVLLPGETAPLAVHPEGVSTDIDETSLPTPAAREPNTYITRMSVSAVPVGLVTEVVVLAGDPPLLTSTLGLEDALLKAIANYGSSVFLGKWIKLITRCGKFAMAIDVLSIAIVTVK